MAEVQDQLQEVQDIQATEQAFAAVLEDGRVVSWGGGGYHAMVDGPESM